MLPLLLLTLAAKPDAHLKPVVVRAHRARQAPRAPAAATTVIDVARQAGEEISTARLLARAPGVVVHRFGGPGQLATLSLRGASSGQCRVLLDGIPLSGALDPAVDLATLPAALLSRIEVMRGVVGPLYGPGALGGAVNLVTRAPEGGPPRVDAEIRGGSFHTGELRLAGQSRAGPGAALVALDASASAGDFGYTPIDAAAPVPRANNDARQLAGLGRYRQSLGPGRAGEILVQLGSGERGLAGTVTDPTPRARLGQSRLLASARLTQKLGSGRLALRTYARDDQLHLLMNAPLDERDSVAGAQAQGRFLLPDNALTLVAEGAGEQAAVEGAPRRSRAHLALAAADEWLLFGGRLSLLPALRVDKVGRFYGVSPRLGLLFRPGAQVALRASVGQSFRAPSFAELYLDQGLLASNPDLKSERGMGADLGVRWRWRWLSLDGGGFATEYANLIEYELYPPFRAKPFNVGTAGVAGLEAEVHARPLRHLRLSLSYTHQWTADLYDDVRYYLHQLPYHPTDRGGARAAWLARRLTAHLEAYAQSAQFLSRANTARLAGRVEVSAGFAFRPVADQPIWLGVEAENLLDTHPEDLYGYPLPGRAFYALCRVTTLDPEQE